MAALPDITLRADQITLKSGDKVQVTVQANDEDYMVASYTWSTTAGQIQGTGATVDLYNTPRKTSATATVSCVIADGSGAQKTATIDIALQYARRKVKLAGVVTPMHESDDVFITKQTSPGLFFKRTMATSTKKVFAHYFGPLPIRINNPASPRDDYYAEQYLLPTGESNAYATKGGYLRNRPAPLAAADIDVAMTRDQFAQQDAAFEIRRARDTGVDGFYVNIMADLMSGGVSTLQGRTYFALRDVASASFSGFYVIPMIDGSSSSVTSKTDAQIVDEFIMPFANQPSTHMVGGKMLIGTFLMEGMAEARWQNILTYLSTTHGITGMYAGVFNSWTTSANYTKDISGPWGPGADPVVAGIDYGSTAHGRGELYQAPVWAQDIRPKSNIFTESCNTEALRAYWDAAITQNAEYVQMCTWSDYGEGSEFNKSVARGLVQTDISAYYIEKFKTGSAPEIVRDVVYVSHRNQMASSTKIAGSPQTEFMTNRSVTMNWSGLKERVEALVFLTAPAQVTIQCGASSQTFAAPAGMSAHVLNATYGSVQVTVTRGGSEIAKVISPVQIKQQYWNEDRQYYMFGSIRGTAEQFDPTPTNTGDKPTYPSV